MTPKQIDFPSERDFWTALIREILSLLRGRKTLDQFSDWLEILTVQRKPLDPKPLDPKRRDILRAGLKLILFAKRHNPSSAPSDRSNKSYPSYPSSSHPERSGP